MIGPKALKSIHVEDHNAAPLVDHHRSIINILWRCSGKHTRSSSLRFDYRCAQRLPHTDSISTSAKCAGHASLAVPRRSSIA